MSSRLRLVGLVGAPIAALLLYFVLPDSYQEPSGQLLPLSSAARATAAVALWMAIWWLTEAIPVYATALLPLAAFPLVGATTIRAAAAPYGHELIFLFLGGFILALALERWGLHKRLALSVLATVGTRPTQIVASFMGLAAVISMWVTNTATTIMLLPVALSVISLVREDGDSQENDNFSIALLLGIAYAASIGGVGTIVGTAPNVFAVSFIQRQMGIEISFLAWMAIGLPLVIVFVPLTWWLLARMVYPVGAKAIDGLSRVLDKLQADLGPASRGEKLTLVVFVLTALAWVSRPFLNRLSMGDLQPLAGLSDSGVAIIAALLLFVIPVRPTQGEFLMDWQTAVKLPWGLLILFGGGLSLAAAIDQSGLSAYLGSLATGLAQLPPPLIVALVTGLMIFLTEVTSNTATTATLLPVLYAVALGLGLDPLLLVVPAAIAASCAFMLPVATPPNAIVFGSGHISVPQMSRIGLRLNLLGIVFITALSYVVIMPVLGVING